MTFRYDGNLLTAVDEMAGVTISRWRVRRDTKEFYFRYESKELVFEFPVTVKSEKRSFDTPQGVDTHYSDVAAYIDPSDVSRAITEDWRPGRYPARPEHRYICEQCREGVFCLMTRGGYSLKFVPDFKVELAERPRPGKR